MSRVAGAILAEEGFKNIYSLSRGMRRWNRWQKILTQCDRQKYKKNSLLVRYLVSFSQTDPSMSLTAYGLNNFKERR